jgi:hypothetical protein
MYHHSQEGSLDKDCPTTPVHELDTPRLRSLDCIVHHRLKLSHSNLANAQRLTKIPTGEGSNLTT